MGLAALAMACAFSTEVNAQNDLRGILGGLIEQSVKGHQDAREEQNDDNDKKGKLGGIIEGLSNIFNKDKIATADDLVGTWKYSEPAVFFESDDVLQNIGGKIAAEKMEARIKTAISKYGLDKNPMTIEFDKDGNFVQTYKKMNLRGTYTVENKEVVLKYSGRYNQIAGRTQIDGNSLVIVMELDRLNQFVAGVASRSTDPRMQFISRLLGSMKGASCGIRFEKL